MKKGFTLMEMLLAVGLASVVFGLAGSLTAFIMERNTRDLKQEELEQAKNDLTVELSNAVRWAKDVEVLSDGVMVDGVSYILDDGKVRKAGEAVTSDDVVINRFEVKNYSATSRRVSLEISVEVSSARSSIYNDSMRIVVSQRQTEVVNGT